MSSYSREFLENMSSWEIIRELRKLKSTIETQHLRKEDAKDVEINICYLQRELSTRAWEQSEDYRRNKKNEKKASASSKV